MVGLFLFGKPMKDKRELRVAMNVPPPPSLVPVVSMSTIVSAPRLPFKMSPMALFPLGMRR